MIAKYLNGMYHPTRLNSIPSDLEFRGVRPGQVFEASGYEVIGLGLNHPGGSVGYRVTDGMNSIAYITDTAPFAKPDEGVHAGCPATPAEERVISFLEGCDLVVYDTMYELAEYLTKMTWGHSYPEYAHSLCRAAGVGRLVLFHHLPDASDSMLDARAASWAEVESPPALLAREGEVVSVEG
jgi:ribonuclease BN (tRNA processing enzyme)